MPTEPSMLGGNLDHLARDQSQSITFDETHHNAPCPENSGNHTFHLLEGHPQSATSQEREMGLLTTQDRKFGALYRRSLSDRSPHPSITIWQQRTMQRVLRRFRSEKQFPEDFFWSSTPAKIHKFTGKSNHIRLPNHLRSII